MWGNSKYTTDFGQVYDYWVLGPLGLGFMVQGFPHRIAKRAIFPIVRRRLRRSMLPTDSAFSLLAGIGAQLHEATQLSNAEFGVL